VKIFLIGFMGVGKSTIGKKLASQMNMEFRDLDRELIKEKSMSIDDIFSYFGEDFFREAEHDYLLRLKEEDHFVLACGGGTPCFHNNMELMNSEGVTIYLQAGLGFISSRLRQSKTVRPLFKNLSESGRDEALRALFARRQAFYKQAKITINVEKLAIGEALQQIAHGLEIVK
jgi:shikimate kinase